MIPSETQLETRQLQLQLDSPLRTELPEGVWYLEVRHPELWHQRQAFHANGSVSVTAQVWPRAVIKGRLSGTRALVPSDLMVTIQSGGEGPSGETTCSLAGDHFSCPVPAGAIDARIRARGYIASHYPDLHLAANETLDVGKMALQRGSSIVGRVEAAPAELRKVRVSAALAGGQSDRAIVSAIPAKSGLFHVDGVAPGEYVIDAILSPERRAKPVRVIVQRDSEIELEDPLLIEQRESLRMAITPPLDPWGSRWGVQIDEEAETGHFETIERRLASDDGTFVSTRLAPGDYHISIGPATGGAWFGQTAHVVPDVPPLRVEIPLQRVREQ